MKPPTPSKPVPPDLTRDPAAVRVEKLPVPVAVRWMPEAGSCHTLEGTVSYAAGDAVLTGVQGESWPVAKAGFKAAYAPVAPTIMGSDGIYRKRRMTALALRLDAPIAVGVGYRRDLLHGQPGDWLVQYGPDDYGIVAAEIFAQTYRIVAKRDT